MRNFMFGKKRVIGIAFILLSFFMETYSKIRLITLQYNRPDFIEMQQRCLNKFLKEKDDYELIVFSDAVDPVCKQQIEQTCERLGIMCVNFPQELHHTGVLINYLRNFTWWPGLDRYNEGQNGSVRHCQIVRYALENFGYGHDDIVGILEGDIFLIRDFSIRDEMKNHDILCATRFDREGKGVEYIWIGLVFVDFNKIPNPKSLNFDIAHIHGAFLDSGGSSHHYLKANSNLRMKNSQIIPILDLAKNNETYLRAIGYSDDELFLIKGLANLPINTCHILLPEFHFETRFLHQSQSRYAGQYEPVSNLFRDFLNRILR
jgi:hypothetical protein